MLSAITSGFPDMAKAVLHRFARDDRGVTAVEAALVLPFMITLYLGGVQLAQGIDIDRKVTLTARALADLTSRVASTDTTEVDTILNAATQVMSPYADSASNASKLKVRVSVIKIDAQLNTTVEWTRNKNWSALQTPDVPKDLKIANTFLVLGEAEYAYDPELGKVLTGTMNLDEKIYMRPRLSTNVECSSCK